MSRVKGLELTITTNASGEGASDPRHANGHLTSIDVEPASGTTPSVTLKYRGITLAEGTIASGGVNQRFPAVNEIDAMDGPFVVEITDGGNTQQHKVIPNIAGMAGFP